jgi:hypothetical protein
MQPATGKRVRLSRGSKKINYQNICRARIGQVSPAHCASRRSALPLLVAGIRADHPHHTLAADDLAVPADLFDGSSNFHDIT